MLYLCTYYCSESLLALAMIHFLLLQKTQQNYFSSGEVYVCLPVKNHTQKIGLCRKEQVFFRAKHTLMVILMLHVYPSGYKRAILVQAVCVSMHHSY